jgi:hypothetical protein
MFSTRNKEATVTGSPLAYAFAAFTLPERGDEEAAMCTATAWDNMLSPISRCYDSPRFLLYLSFFLYHLTLHTLNGCLFLSYSLNLLILCTSISLYFCVFIFIRNLPRNMFLHFTGLKYSCYKWMGGVRSPPFVHVSPRAHSYIISFQIIYMYYTLEYLIAFAPPASTERRNSQFLTS